MLIEVRNEGPAGCTSKLGEFLFAPVGRMLKYFPPFKRTDFVKCVRELRITLYVFCYAVLKQHSPFLWMHILFIGVYKEVNNIVVTFVKKSGSST
jgi:hypothetical protein